ncbi:MAG: hypothetical protein A2020_06445 [Lentisphaerae bacterium GWF2_45_14]|nr:MAG: hypothetical protein A2020_06445 [Lentisphaerae bacterium GWF2_45_14]
MLYYRVQISEGQLMRNIQFPEHETLAAKNFHEGKSLLVYAVGLIITVAVMVLFGLTMLYSTSFGTAGSAFFMKQFMWACVGLAGATAIFLIGYQRLSDYSVPFACFVMFLLVIADFFFPAVKGAHRWIKIPGLGNIQPSEFAKVAMILFIARSCSDRMRYINDIFKGLFPVFIIIAPIMGLVLLGKDLGTTTLLAAVAVLMLFVSGLKLRWLIPPFLIVPPTILFYLKNFDPERWSRLTTYTNPEICQKTDGYQLWNSLLALGSGHWGGLGFMESRMKAKYLPEAHTDFILSIVGEELGYAGLLLIIAGYLSFMYFALKISISSQNKQGMLLGFGATAVIIIQASINIGVISGAFPTKGMPAPFISYGGSNLVMAFMCAGLLVSIAIDSAYPGFNKEVIVDIKKKFSSIF